MDDPKTILEGLSATDRAEVLTRLLVERQVDCREWAREREAMETFRHRMTSEMSAMAADIRLLVENERSQSQRLTTLEHRLARLEMWKHERGSQ